MLLKDHTWRILNSMETSLEDGTDTLQPTKVQTQKQTNAIESLKRLKDYFQNHQSLLWL